MKEAPAAPFRRINSTRGSYGYINSKALGIFILCELQQLFSGAAADALLLKYMRTYFIPPPGLKPEAIVVY